MTWGGSLLVLSVWSPKSLLYLNKNLFLKILKIFCHYIIENVFYLA
jgi:hypothetical protein